jgi:hypothetical protein
MRKKLDEIWNHEKDGIKSYLLREKALGLVFKLVVNDRSHLIRLS